MKKVSYREYSKALSEIRDQLPYDCGVEIMEMRAMANDRIQLGVNWACMGTKPVSEARNFAELLSQAVALCEAFPYNGYEIEW